jgi:hypothetical protein
VWPKWFLIIHQNEYVYEKVDLWLAVDGENVKGLDGHAECLLSDFTDEDETTGDEDETHSQTSMGLMATEAISTAILKEKKWVLHLYLIPESHDHNDDEWDVQYQYKKLHPNKPRQRIRTHTRALPVLNLIRMTMQTVSLFASPD